LLRLSDLKPQYLVPTYIHNGNEQNLNGGSIETTVPSTYLHNENEQNFNGGSIETTVPSTYLHKENEQNFNGGSIETTCSPWNYFPLSTINILIGKTHKKTFLNVPTNVYWALYVHMYFILWMKNTLLITGRPSQSVCISWLWHYIHYLSIPLYTINVNAFRRTACIKVGNICFYWK